MFCRSLKVGRTMVTLAAGVDPADATTDAGKTEGTLTIGGYLMYSFSTPLRLGCRSLRSALASIWRIRSRVTSKI